MSSARGAGRSGARLAALAVALLAAGVPAPLAATDAPPTLEAIAVWQQRVPGGDWDVHYSILGRPAGGASGSQLAWWTVQGEAGAPLVAVAGDDENPHVGVRPGAGAPAIAVWQRREPDGTQDVFWSRFTGEAPTGWAAPGRLAAVPGDDFDPAVAVDSDGTALVAWVNLSGEGSGLLWSRWDGAAWSAPAPIPEAVRPSLPEITFLDAAGPPGGSTPHRALVAFSDLVLDPSCGAKCPPIHRTRASRWDGLAWSAAETIPLDAAQASLISEHGFADYTVPLEAFDRLSVGAAAGGAAIVLWGAPLSEADRWNLTWVQGSRLDPVSGGWEALRWKDGQAGCPSRHSPDLAMTGSDDAVVVFGSHGGLEHVRRVQGEWASEGATLDILERDDLRASLAPLADRLLVVEWSKPWDPGAQGSTITWSLGTLRPAFGDVGPSVTWEDPRVLTQEGEARYPEVASTLGGTSNPLHVGLAGRAYGAEIWRDGEPVATVSDTGDAGPGDGEASERAAEGPPNPLVSLAGIEARTSRSADTSTSTVTIDEVALATDPAVVIRNLRVVAEASCSYGRSARTTIGSLQVGAGPPTAMDARTNTSVPLGVLTLRVNEQNLSPSTAAVRGLRLVGEGLDFTIGYASAALDGCVGSGPPAAVTEVHDH